MGEYGWRSKVTRGHRRFTLSRDLVLFIVGLAGIINEAARHGTERVGLLVLYAGMVGLPAFIPKNGPPPDDGPEL